jgi:hypothetical protein
LGLTFIVFQSYSCKTKNSLGDESNLESGFTPNSLITLSDTIFKISPNAPTKGDCSITGQHQVKTMGKDSAGHVEIEFTAPVPGCEPERKKGWIFKGHIMDSKKVATVIRRATLFNGDKKPICSISPTIVLMLTEHLQEGSYTKFRPMPSFVDQLPANCEKLPTYYISTSSFVKGVQAISLSKFAILKSRPAQTDELTKGTAETLNTRMCYLAPGLYPLEKPISLEGGHYKLQFSVPIHEVPLQEPFEEGSNVLNNPAIAKKLPNGKMACRFADSKVGYLWPTQSDFADPNAKSISGGSGDYYYPLRPGQDPAITSNWCELRNIGTSPHIGTDFADYPAVLTSQAIFSGRIDSIEFGGPTCGYEVFLTDDRGAVWRYMHCNAPNLKVGQRVKGGDVMCTHSQYPRLPCGLGTHLHLDRYKLGTGYPPARPAPHYGCNLDSESLFLDRDKVLH